MISAADDLVRTTNSVRQFGSLFFEISFWIAVNAITMSLDCKTKIFQLLFIR